MNASRAEAPPALAPLRVRPRVPVRTEAPGDRPGARLTAASPAPGTEGLCTGSQGRPRRLSPHARTPQGRGCLHGTGAGRCPGPSRPRTPRRGSPAAGATGLMHPPADRRGCRRKGPWERRPDVSASSPTDTTERPSPASLCSPLRPRPFPVRQHHARQRPAAASRLSGPCRSISSWSLTVHGATREHSGGCRGQANTREAETLSKWMAKAPCSGREHPRS